MSLNFDPNQNYYLFNKRNFDFSRLVVGIQKTGVKNIDSCKKLATNGIISLYLVPKTATTYDTQIKKIVTKNKLMIK